MKKSFFACLALSSAAAVFDPTPAVACGGCFVQPTERTVVTDHRMALSVSTTQTVLWDQIRYSGDPAEFAWVLPVRAGAKIEVSNDAFFTALDASTQAVVVPPNTYGGAFGCGLAGCGTSQTSSAESSGPGPGQVQILSQAVVGPYETVTLRATDSGALRNWLKSHAYAIPPAVEPIIDGYVAESFDFIALRLRPDCGERSMQPVRIVTQGADPTLPLRMVAAGIGARVGLTLYVVSEGRWQPQNFPHVPIDEDRILWDRSANRSTYEPLVQDLMSGAGGRTWVIEYAQKPQLFTTSDPRYATRRSPDYVTTGAATGVTPGLADTYYGLCRTRASTASPAAPSAPSGQPFTPCRNGADASVTTPAPSNENDDAADGGSTSDPTDAGSDASDDDAGDAGDQDAEAGRPDASATDAGEPSLDTPAGPPSGDCAYLDDLDVALRGLHPKDVWITRMRASLASGTLGAGDLRLEAATEQSPVQNVHYTTTYTDEVSAGSGSRDACLSAPKRHTAFGTWAFGIVAGIAAVAFLRRRPRR